VTRDDIIRMAREAGFDEWWDNGCSSWDTLQETFERFAALVAAAERSACIDLVAMYGGPVDLEAAIRRQQVAKIGELAAQIAHKMKARPLAE
jgi:hypothetical protein